MLTDGVWAEIRVGNEHLRLFSEHNAQGVQASVYNVTTKSWLAPSEPVEDIEQGKERAAERARSYLEDAGHSGLPPLKWKTSDFATGFDPRLAKAIVSTSKAMASGVAGYLSWTAWPAKTEAYMWGHFEDILYGRQTIASYLKNVDQVFQSEKAAGALPLVPKPAGM